MFILYRLVIYVVVVLKCIPKLVYQEIKTDMQIFTEDLLTKVCVETPAFKKSENLLLFSTKIQFAAVCLQKGKSVFL